MDSQEGVVIAVSGKMAKVKVARHSSCESCGSCPGNAATVVDAVNEIGAEPGQRVVLEVKQANMLKAAFVVYMLPLIGIFGGAVIGSYLADRFLLDALIWQIAGGSVGLGLTALYIWLFDRKAGKQSEMQPVILSIIP